MKDGIKNVYVSNVISSLWPFIWTKLCQYGGGTIYTSFWLSIRYSQSIWRHIAIAKSYLNADVLENMLDAAFYAKHGFTLWKRLRI